MNIEALKQLWKYLQEVHNCIFLVTNTLCQDCLENFFSEIRRRCGYNDSLNTFQFGSAFRNACITAIDQNYQGTNCKKDGYVPLLTERDFMETESSLNSSSAIAIQNDPSLDLSQKVLVRKSELSALVYVLGAAAAKIKHIKCKDRLVARNAQAFVNNEDYKFCLLKASFAERNINIPSNLLYDIGLQIFTIFKLKFKRFLYENRRYVKLRLKRYMDHGYYDHAICKSCFDALIDRILNTLIKGFLNETRLKKMFQDKVRRRVKRNRKAVRMNLTAK